MTPLLDIDRLVAGYGEPIAGPLTFSVSENDIIGLWGPNGAGKSTFLKAIVGTARIMGGTIRQHRPIRLSYQQQHPVRLPEMPLTAHEFLRFIGAHLAGLPASLTSVLQQRLDSLSGGQFQLLSLWAVLAGQADLVLLDEPTNNLDPRTIAILPQMLRDQSAGRAILLVSHERNMMETVCTRILEVSRWN
jgi:zinc transport system ATP-binding protein